MNIQCDIIIIGGGITGLWAFHRLLQAGFDVYLLENNALGSGQTMASQGIIHGGSKYALTGKLSEAARTIAQMTQVWADCFAGVGEIDLSHVPFLSHHHYLWMGGFGADLKAAVSSKALSSHNRVLKREEYPGVFAHQSFRGSLCELDEIVLDVPALVHALAKPFSDRLIKSNENWQYQFEGKEIKSVSNGHISFSAQQFVLTAGEGIDQLKWDVQLPKMQRRPLKMVVVKRLDQHEIFAHYLEHSVLPKMTITTHPVEGGTIWYLGGAIAEKGVDVSDETQISRAKKELKKILPWLNHTQNQYACLSLDRAEGFNGGKRPNSFILEETGNVLVAWPTKLTLAPALASAILKKCETLQKQGQKSVDCLEELEKAVVATPPWEGLCYVR